MKDIAVTNRFRIFIAVAMIIFCGATIFLFLEASVISESNIEKPRIEKKGRLTILEFGIQVAGIAEPIQVRAVVSRETVFRVTYSIARNFPHLDAKRLETEKILWNTERLPPGKKYQQDSWVGVFRAFDGDLGYVHTILHAHRIYRKYLNEFAIDYVINTKFVSRNELAMSIREIDEDVFHTIEKNGGFSQ